MDAELTFKPGGNATLEKTYKSTITMREGIEELLEVFQELSLYMIHTLILM